MVETKWNIKAVYSPMKGFLSSLNSWKAVHTVLKGNKAGDFLANIWMDDGFVSNFSAKMRKFLENDAEGRFKLPT